MKASVLLASLQADVPECFTSSSEATKARTLPFHYLFTFESSGNVTAESLKAASFQFGRVGWTFTGDNSVSLQKLLRRFFSTLEKARPSQEWALIVGLTESKRLTLTPQGEYWDKSAGKAVTFEEASQIFEEESPRQRHFWRAVAEITAALGLGIGWYWTNIDFNKPDWKLNGDWKSWRRKFITGDAIRFDSNSIIVNINAHPWYGALFYSLARQNGMRSYEAYLMGFAASVIWEFAVEYREFVSINDLIMTPEGGQALGEVFTQLGWFFDQGADNRMNQVLSGIFTAPQKFHDWLDRNTKRFRKVRSKNLDRYGFSKDIFHRFQLSAALGAQSFTGAPSGMLAETRLETHLVHIPGDATWAGTTTKIIYDTAMTDLVFRMGKSSNGFQEVMLYTRAVLAGVLKRSTTQGNRPDTLNGYRFFIGPSMGYTLEARDFPDKEGMISSEGMGIAHVLGNSIDVLIFKDDLKIHLSLDVFADFAAIRSLAVKPYEEKQYWPSSTLMNSSRYGFDFGISLKTLTVVEYRRAEIGIEAEKGTYSGIHGRDDNQEYIDEEMKVESKILEEIDRVRGWIGYLLPGDQWKLLLSLEARRHRSVLDEASVRQIDARALGTLMFQF